MFLKCFLEVIAITTIIPSIGLRGIEGYKVQVEVQLIPGEGISIVGLPNTSVKESKDRVMAALYASDCIIPDKKIIINLSPAEQKKNSPLFDLAIAIGIMKAGGFIQHRIPEGAAFLGVLSLDGTVHPIEGMLPAILAAKKVGFKVLYLPYIEEISQTRFAGLEFRFASTLSEVIESFTGKRSRLQKPLPLLEKPPINTNTYDKDFKHVLGHNQAKRALEIAAAGGHNVLMSGPPGCGKSLLAETFPSILPPLSKDLQFELLSIYQLAHMTKDSYEHPPFRAPHHTSSGVALVGGGSNPRPGEISLAHHGVLFLDEMAEFPKRVLDMLRQPIETGKVTISRAASSVTYPSRFLLLGAMNPCPCGFLGSKTNYCTCSPKQIKAYQNRISGPILDRMDILLFLSTVSLDDETTENNEPSHVIRERVQAARDRQKERYRGEMLNVDVSNEFLLDSSPLTSDQQRMLQQISSKQNWSTRVQMKVLRIARTISDINGDEFITDSTLWEAMTMRRMPINKSNKAMGL